MVKQNKKQIKAKNDFVELPKEPIKRKFFYIITLAKGQTKRTFFCKRSLPSTQLSTNGILTVEEGYDAEKIFDHLYDSACSAHNISKDGTAVIFYRLEEIK